MKSALNSKIRGMMIGRVAMISLVLGAVIVYKNDIASTEIIRPVSALIAATYFLTILYAIALDRLRESILTPFAYAQLFIDLLISTGVIYLTGGIISPLAFLYIIVIIGASIVLFRVGSFVIASGASILYGLLANLQLLDIIDPPMSVPSAELVINRSVVFFNVLIHMIAFYLVAYLSSYLAEGLRKTGMELQKTGEDLTSLRSLHDRILDSMGSGLIVTDEMGLVSEHNPAALEILRLSRDMVVGMPAAKILQLQKLENMFNSLNEHNRLLSQTAGSIDSLAQKNFPQYYDWAYFRPDGTRAFLNATFSVSRDDEGNIERFIGVINDTTNMKEMEQKIARSERLAALGRVSSGIAHEIRNPLGAMSGSIQMLKESLYIGLNDKQKRLMDITLRETDRLNEIVTQFLLYASPAQAKPRPVVLLKVVQETFTLLESSKSHTIKFVNEIEDGLTIPLDEQQFRQVLWNLFINACHAMTDGGTLTVASRRLSLREFESIELRLRRVGRRNPFAHQGEGLAQAGGILKERHEFVEITVHDTGSGIAEENFDKLFEPFFTTKENGTGLGLPTVYKIVRNHHGFIDVTSAQGVGTTFYIYLPVDRSGEYPESNIAG